MTLLHPIWLVLLMPWLAVALRVLRRSPASPAVVPFLPLWASRAILDHTPATRRWAAPLPIVLLLLATLCGIVALAGPVQSRRRIDVTIILDRGLQTSLAGGRAAAIDRVASRLRAGHIVLQPVPGERLEFDGDAWVHAAHALTDTAIETRPAIEAAVERALGGTQQPVLVLSALPLAPRPRLLRVSTGGSIENVGVASASLNGTLHAQAMVRVRNDSDARKATIRCGPVERAIDLPPQGQERSYFLDVPAPVADRVDVQLMGRHTSPLNDRAFLLRPTPTPMRWVTHERVPDAISRFTNVYSKLRPATEDVEVGVIHPESSDDRLSPDVRLVDAIASGPSRIIEPTIVPDPITRRIDRWPLPANPAARPPAGWRTLASRGEVPLVAIDPPCRSAWVNAQLEAWSSTPDFVVFLAQVLDALSRPTLPWTSRPATELGTTWRAVTPVPAGTAPGERPGVYRRGNRNLAINAPPVQNEIAPSSDDVDGIASLRRFPTKESISPWLIMLATVLVSAAVLWRNK